MTRLDVSIEPSMEDILASIRKIIAEDPPGSRPVPPVAQAQAFQFPVVQAQQTQLQSAQSQPAQSQPAQYQSAQPSPQRAAPVVAHPSYTAFARTPAQEPFFQAPSGYEAVAAAPEPFLSAMVLLDDLPPARVEPSFAALSAPKLEPLPAAALSVEAQLSDLLGEVAPQEFAIPEPPAVSPASAMASPASVKPQIDFAAKLMGRPTPSAIFENAAAAEFTAKQSRVEESRPEMQPEMQPEARPGFTVSRVGFVPAEPQATRDPFDFDLGPSPFDSKPFDSNSVDQAPAAVSAPEEPSVAAFPVAEPALEESQPASVAAFEIAPSTVSAVAPTVDAALQLIAHSPVAAFAPSSPEVALPAQAVVEHVVPEAISEPIHALATDATQHAPLHIASETNAAPASTTATSLSVSSHSMNAPRSMEDAVADLLRPMLKNWLAENMPRIVERALRRELSEQLHSEHKTAAE